MEKEIIEVYSNKVNKCIVRNNGRQFPGIVLQGDNLYKLYSHSMEIVEDLEFNNNRDAFLNSLSLAERLESLLLNYEKVILDHGFEIPYNRDESNSTQQYQHYWDDEDCD